MGTFLRIRYLRYVGGFWGCVCIYVYRGCMSGCLPRYLAMVLNARCLNHISHWVNDWPMCSFRICLRIGLRSCSLMIISQPFTLVPSILLTSPCFDFEHLLVLECVKRLLVFESHKIRERVLCISSLVYRHSSSSLANPSKWSHRLFPHGVWFDDIFMGISGPFF